MSGEATKTVKLSQAYDHDGKRYAELTLRRPIVEDAFKARTAGGDDAMSQEPHLLARVAGVPVELIYKLDLYRDYLRLQGVIADFQTASLPASGSDGSGAAGSSPQPDTPETR